MLDRFLAYNLWANTRLVENIRSVPADTYANLPLAPFGSMHETLRHLVGAETIWLDRVRGTSPADFMGITDGRSTDELLEMLLAASRSWVELSTAPTGLPAEVTYATTKGDPFTQSVADLVLHVVNHSTYHRGQIMSLLRSVYDGRLGGLDMILFARTTR